MGNEIERLRALPAPLYYLCIYTMEYVQCTLHKHIFVNEKCQDVYVI